MHHSQRLKVKSFLCISKKLLKQVLINLHEKLNNNEVICHNEIKVLCPRSGSQGKVKQNDNLCAVQDSGSLAVFKVTPKAQGHYKGPSGAFVTYCNIFVVVVFLSRRRFGMVFFLRL